MSYIQQIHTKVLYFCRINANKTLHMLQFYYIYLTCIIWRRVWQEIHPKCLSDPLDGRITGDLKEETKGKGAKFLA